MGAHLGHGHPVGEGADMREHHPLASLQGGLQAVGILRLHTDHPDLGAQVLDVGRDSGNQATSAYRNEDSL